MREILFRGKCNETCKYNGQWIEGFYGEDDGKPIIAHSTDRGLIGYFCEPDSIGQYTGLTDKNGKKIFEGDVLNVHDQIPMFDGYDTDEIVYNGKVMYIKNQGMYVCEGNNDGNALCALNLDKCEVIGNIHDNPELLEVKK